MVEDNFRYNECKTRALFLESQIRALENQLTLSSIMSLRREVNENETKWSSIPHYDDFIADNSAVNIEDKETVEVGGGEYRYTMFDEHSDVSRIEYFSHDDVKDHRMAEYCIKYSPLFATKWCVRQQILIENVHFTNVAVLLFDNSVNRSPETTKFSLHAINDAKNMSSSSFWRCSEAPYERLFVSITAIESLFYCQVILSAQPSNQKVQDVSSSDCSDGSECNLSKIQDANDAYDISMCTRKKNSPLSTIFPSVPSSDSLSTISNAVHIGSAENEMPRSRFTAFTTCDLGNERSCCV